MILAIDSSAVVAVALSEETGPWLIDRADRADDILISAANVVEVSMVVEAKTAGAVTGQRAIDRFGCRVVDIDSRFAETAVLAWRRFGKGRHRAALNYGDCFSYALARTRGVPLLCVGDDFKHTDLEVWAP